MKHLLLWALAAVAHPLAAQLPLAWRAPVTVWDTVPNDTLHLSRQGRSLRIERLPDEGWSPVPVVFYMDPYKEFRIEASVTRLAANSQSEWGLYWGGDERGRGFAFVMNAAGQYRVLEVGEKLVELIPWTKLGRLKKAGPHQLAIGRIGGRWELMVEDKVVTTLLAKRIYGKRHGFFVKGKVTLLAEGPAFRRREQIFPEAEGGFPLAVRWPLDSTLNTPGHETNPLRSENGRKLFFTRSPEHWQMGRAWYSPAGSDSVRWETPLPFTDADGLVLKETVVAADPYANFPILLRRSPAGKSLTEWIMADSSGRTLMPLPPDFPAGYTDVTLSPDRKTLVFSMDKPEGNGAMDLYVSFRDEKGQWSAPRNLGPEVNSFGREFSPYLMPDLTTLYFSSTGRWGYGEADVYVTRRLNNAWSSWTPAENLGPGINAGSWNAWYRPFEKGDRAYMASIPAGKQDFDLFYVRVPVDIKSRPVVKLYGKLLDKATNQPVPGLIRFRPLDPGFLPFTRQTSGEGADYFFYLPYGCLWEVLGETEGYFSVLDTLNLRPVKFYRDVRHDVFLSRPEAGMRIQLDNVYFERATPVLLDSSYAELDRLVALMMALPTLEIAIHGHTDNIGQPDVLQKLSEDRAAVVRQFLVDKGIGAARITAQGFGATLPIADNANPDERPKNRRVEFVVIRR